MIKALVLVLILEEEWHSSTAKELPDKIDANPASFKSLKEMGECHSSDFLFDLWVDMPKIKQFILKTEVYMLSLHDHFVGCKSYLKAQENLKLCPGLLKIQLGFTKL